MKTCATCQHWEVEADYENGYISGTKRIGLGICRAVPMLWNAMSNDLQGLAPGMEKTTAFAQDGSDYQAFLYTKGEHGCTMHKEKT
jgi:hypothetical protein